MSTLDQTYRRALRWYPRKWRTRNEDAVVGTLLDLAEEDHRTAPARGELADLRASGLAVRLGPLGRIPGPVRDRVVALLFGLGSGIAIVAPIALATQRAGIPPAALRYFTIVGPFVGYLFVIYAVWLLALIAALIGRRWVARAVACIAVVLDIALKIAEGGFQSDFGRASTTTTIVFLAIIAILSFTGNPFGTRRGRVWIAVSTAVSAAFIGLTLVYRHVTQGGAAGSTDWYVGPFFQWMGWLFPLVIVLALVLWRATRTAWAPAILLTEVPIILFALLGWQSLDTVVATLAYVAAGIATLVGCYWLLRAFGVRIRITRA